MSQPDPVRIPDRVFVSSDGAPPLAAAAAATTRAGARWTAASTEVTLTGGAGSQSVAVSCAAGSIAYVVLRWDGSFATGTLFLGDHWERGYGDLQWRTLQPERVMPWYFAAHDPATGRTTAAGVKTQPAAVCFWTADADGVSLWIDLRNGGAPSVPGPRVIDACTIVSRAGAKDESPFALLKRFCKTMCDRPRLPKEPVCGNNNWYYAYGHNFDADTVRRDAAFLAEISAGCAVRPFCVIDAGWSPGGVCPGGPWTAGLPGKFPDMPALAADIRKLGVRPGIWARPTALSFVDDPKRLRAGPQGAPEKALDLTIPENLETIRADVARIRGWGYELIKHDFSTFDAFARWGFEMGAELTDAGWHWANRSLTNAEVLLRLYRTLRDGAGDAMLLGCNTIGHLGAGLFELQRTGDDTSGRAWERTRRMGVNTMAFRLPQHGTFFDCDADCAAHTERTPWDKDRQWLELVAHSGTPLFISVDPAKASPEVKAAFRDAMRLALAGGAGRAEPLDWMTTTEPRRWAIGDAVVEYDWTEPAGTWPFRI